MHSTSLTPVRYNSTAPSPANLSPRGEARAGVPGPIRGANLQADTEAVVSEQTQQSNATPITTLSSTNVSHKSHRSSSKSNKSVRRIELLVSTGSSKIAISGLVDTAEPPNLPMQAHYRVQDTLENTASDQVEEFSLFEAAEDIEDGVGSEDDGYKV